MFDERLPRTSRARCERGRPSIEMQVPFGGVPGQVQNYIAVAGTDPKGTPGKYRVVFTLSRDRQSRNGP
jgi:hypothetical protein